MRKWAREAEHRSYEIFGIEPPFSNFDFVDREYPGLPTLRRIFSQVRAHQGRTMVRELLGEAEDIREENEDLQKIRGAVTSRVERLSFFTKAFGSTRGLRSATPDEFLGYVVVKNDKFSSEGPPSLHARIYESVVRQSRRSNNYIHRPQCWTCSVVGNELPIRGYLYAQQNGLTNCCAHVAVRTAAAAFHPKGDMSYREMNQALGGDHVRRSLVGAGARGVQAAEMRQLLEAAGAHCCVLDYTIDTPITRRVPYDKYVYGSVESGYPAIVCFRLTDRDGRSASHAVPIFGHTFNEDTWVPSAEFLYFRVGPRQYIPSELWVSTYIGHDDNAGSNFCIPRGYLRGIRHCEEMSGGTGVCPRQLECVACVIATIPAAIRAEPLHAEIAAADYLPILLDQMPGAYGGCWGERLRRYASEGRAVLRPMIVSMDEYVAHLSQIRDWEGQRVSPVILSALTKALQGDKRWWMVEYSLPELFPANRRKVGEILLRADAPLRPTRDLGSFLLARLPGCFAFVRGGTGSRPRFAFIRSGCPGHVPLFEYGDPPG